MKEISHLLRKAYLDLLQPLTVEGVIIPIGDTLLNVNQSPVTYRSGIAYVLVTDQTETETSNNDCGFRQNASIVFDCIVKYPNGSGSKLAVELISGAIQEKVVSLGGQFIQIGLTGFQILNTQKAFAQSFTELGETLTVFRKRITFTQQVWQSSISSNITSPQNTLNLTLNSVL
jgi:hypothetical protein